MLVSCIPQNPASSSSALPLQPQLEHLSEPAVLSCGLLPTENQRDSVKWAVQLRVTLNVLQASCSGNSRMVQHQLLCEGRVRLLPNADWPA